MSTSANANTNLDPKRWVWLLWQVKVEIAQHLSDAMAWPDMKLTRDEVIMLMEWRNEVRAEAEFLRMEMTSHEVPVMKHMYGGN